MQNISRKLPVQYFITDTQFKTAEKSCFVISLFCNTTILECWLTEFGWMETTGDSIDISQCVFVWNKRVCGDNKYKAGGNKQQPILTVVSRRNIKGIKKKI